MGVVAVVKLVVKLALKLVVKLVVKRAPYYPLPYYPYNT